MRFNLHCFEHFLIISLILITGNQAQNSCTVSGKSGSCVNIHECHDLYKIFRSNTTSDDDKLLNASRCEPDALQFKVCCEIKNDCTAPDKAPGRCVHIFQCPRLKTLLALQDPLPSVIEYLDQSHAACEHSDPNIVCCNNNLPHVTPAKDVASILPKKNECGINALDDRITGGEETGRNQYPWMVLIECKTSIDSKINKLSCGGSLISSKYVLTAGHCFKSNKLKPVSVRLGEFDTTTDLDCDQEYKDQCNNPHESIYIEKVIVHPDYNNPSDFKNDIALIRLERPVKFTINIRPVCLPTKDITVDLPNKAANFTAVGWGATEDKTSSDKKLHVKIPYIDLANCNQHFNIEKNFNVKLWDTQLCAGGFDGKDTCSGDSGGPLLMNEEPYEIVGVVSYGTRFCGTSNVPAVYTKVFKYLDWIHKEIEL